jgi:hypothetical protein
VIRVVLPQHLRTLSGVQGELQLDVGDGPTIGGVIDAIEAQFPNLRGTIRDHYTGQRRPMVRYYCCEEDMSHEPEDTPLPADIISGKEPFIVLGAMSGG